MATERPATQAKRVLVVEDEPMIRMLLEDMLGELGYTIAAEAARIEEALEATKNADFDLAILGVPRGTRASATGEAGWPLRLAAWIARAKSAVFVPSHRSSLRPASAAPVQPTSL